jgi:carboxypeptidase PM20D1
VRTFLLRLLLVLVSVTGILTAVAVARMTLVSAEPRFREAPHPFTFPESEAVERLAGALRIPTVSFEEPEARDPEAFLRFHRYLAASFPRIHESLRVETVSDLSLLMTWEGTDPGAAPILLGAHQDVVPVEEETLEAWTHPPFSGAVADGYVWGRGALDMKAPLMGILEAVEGLLAEGFTPRRTVLLAFGHDEEVGGWEGAARIVELLEERGIRPAWALDEGAAIATGMVPGVRDPVGLVGTAEKGYLTLALEATGEGGHSSAPPRVTAVGTVARAVARLEENPFPARIEGPVRGLLETLAPHMDPGTKLLATNLWLFGRPLKWALGAQPTTGALVRTTTAPTVFQAGLKDNILPTRARALVNFRIAPWDTPESVEARVRELVADLDVQVSVDNESFPPVGPSPVSSTDTEGFRTIREAIHRTFPDVITVAPFLVFAATDGRHWARVADDVYRFAPFRAEPEVMERIHGVDERVPVNGYLDMVRFYAELIQRGGGEG